MADPAPAVGPSRLQVTQAPSFAIEKIVVEGVRHGSEKVVVSELLLTLGSAYTEAQLREALHRVKRLPFVVDADFSLRKGSERGRFELVVTVAEAWPVFFGGSLAVAGDDDSYSDTEWFALATPQVGVRAFFGGQNEVSATLTGFATAERFDSSGLLLDASYRHHNLFGHHVVGTLFLRTPQTLRRGQEIGASLGVPLSRASTLDAGFSRNEVTFEPLAFSGGSSNTTRRGVLAFRRDSTDDPFTARSGSRLLSELSYSTTSSKATRPFPPFGNPGTPGSAEVWNHDSTGQGLGGSLAGRRYWPLSPRSSFGLGLSLSAAWDSFDTTGTSGEQVQRWSYEGRSGSSLVDAEVLRTLPRLSRGLTEFWWSAKATLGARFSRVELASGDVQPPYPVIETRSLSAGVSFSLAARGRWGIARLELLWNHDFRPSIEQR